MYLDLFASQLQLFFRGRNCNNLCTPSWIVISFSFKNHLWYGTGTGWGCLDLPSHTGHYQERKAKKACMEYKHPSTKEMNIFIFKLLKSNKIYDFPQKVSTWKECFSQFLNLFQPADLHRVGLCSQSRSITNRCRVEDLWLNHRFGIISYQIPTTVLS